GLGATVRALSNARRGEKGKWVRGKVRGSKTPLERAEMHTEAFVQVTAVWRLVCGAALCWCSALGDPSLRCSVPAVLLTVRDRSAVVLPRRAPRRCPVCPSF